MLITRTYNYLSSEYLQLIASLRSADRAADYASLAWYFQIDSSSVKYHPYAAEQ